MSKKVVISCGPIPARLDPVKFISNRFKGGLAFKTAKFLLDCEYDLTIVVWEHTILPAELVRTIDPNHIVRVSDVFGYFDWFVEHAQDFDAFVMAAAVANLTPVKPYENKFPSHLYTPGESFDIPFMIAPRAIDAIKQRNPRCCLVGYKLYDAPDEELIEIARHTLADAKANIIFANHPATAKDKKIAVTPDGAAIPCDFDQHLELMRRAIDAEYYSTEVVPLTEAEQADLNVKEALSIVSMFEGTFSKYGTVAVPVPGMLGAFATTARGHKDGPVLVRSIDHDTHTIHASGKSTLNAPALQSMLNGSQTHIVVHRHEDDPRYGHPDCREAQTCSLGLYLFPGTMEERCFAALAAKNDMTCAICSHHGWMRRIPILPVDWTRYHDTFPAKYFSIPQFFQDMLDRFKGKDTLEIGGNDSPVGKYSYDPYVSTDKAINLSWDEVMDRRFDLIFAKNAINYLSMTQIKALLNRASCFIANTFLTPPNEKITENEVSILMGETIRHTLLLPDDSLMRHEFYAYTKEDWLKLDGVSILPYGKNSCMVITE